MRYAFLLFLAATLALNAISPAAALLEWNTFGNAGTETVEPSVTNAFGILSSNLTLGPGVSGAGNTNRFGGNNWFDAGDTSAGDGTTLAESIADDDYIQFTITPDAGITYSVTSFVFSWERSGTGPSAVALRSSTDSFGSDLGSITGFGTSLSTGNTINIAGLSGLSTPTTFRFYGYNATSSAGTGGFDTASNTVNVVLNGTAVPEPSTLLIVFGGLGMLSLSRRRPAR